MKISVLVPLRPGVCPHRDRAWAWCRAWWRRTFPEWEIVTASDAPEGPWRKAVAVDGAVRRSSGEILVVADADVFSDGVGPAVEAVAHGAPWAMPHVVVSRLSELGTARVLAGEDPARVIASNAAKMLVERHQAKIAGGLVVLSRDAWRVAPMDPRFAGWGGEDESWGYALTTLVGAPARLGATLVHLWHPPQERRSRARGSRENEDLRRRYVEAHLRPDDMRALVAGREG